MMQLKEVLASYPKKHGDLWISEMEIYAKKIVIQNNHLKETQSVIRKQM